VQAQAEPGKTEPGQTVQGHTKMGQTMQGQLSRDKLCRDKLSRDKQSRDKMYYLEGKLPRPAATLAEGGCSVPPGISLVKCPMKGTVSRDF
jgi:hypothetical protein